MLRKHFIRRILSLCVVALSLLSCNVGAVSSSEPPHQLIFSQDYRKELADLYALLEQDDESIEAYLSSTDYSMNGLRTRLDLEKLFQVTQEPYYPFKEDSKMIGMTIYPESGWNSHLFYDFDAIRYSFTITTIEFDKIVRDAEESGDILVPLNDEGDVHVYLDGRSEHSDNYVFALDVGGRYVMVVVSSENDFQSVVNGLLAFEYGSLVWQEPAPQLNTDNTAYINGYEDGTVRPEAQITREEVAVIFYRLLTENSRDNFETSANAFSDVAADRWSNTAISTLANAGVLNGYADGTFRPSSPITRAELVKIVTSIGNISGENLNNPFTDVSGHWAESHILLAANVGWITGYDDYTFRPNKNITRAETMVIVNRVLGRDESDISKITNMKTWSDNTDTSKWYYKGVQIATNSY